MSLRLVIAERFLPEAVRNRSLDELAGVVAKGFGCRPPQWRGEPFPSRLEEFARLTATEAAAAHAAGRAAAVKPGLRAGARRLGADLRRRLGVRTHDEAVRALVLLYRQLGIELRIDGTQVEIPRCSFSTAYSPAACEIMSAVDQGLVDGLTAGWILTFSSRLSAGAPACRAVIAPPREGTA